MTMTSSEAEAAGQHQGQDPGGCSHYRNKCEILAPCCDSYYRCHRCHNEEREFTCGLLDRSSIRRIRCVACHHVQSPAEECDNCHVRFAEHACLKCHLFREAAPDTGLFHCPDCGICRVGKGLGEGGSHWHCRSCCACLPNSLDRAAHAKVCRPAALKDSCAICFENMHDSTEECVPAPYCGHYLHLSCYQEYLRSGKVKCPLCQKPMIDESIIKRAERRQCVVRISYELARILGLYLTFRLVRVRENNAGDMDAEILHVMLGFVRVAAMFWWEGPRRGALQGMNVCISLMIYALILTNLIAKLEKFLIFYLKKAESNKL